MCAVLFRFSTALRRKVAGVIFVIFSLGIIPGVLLAGNITLDCKKISCEECFNNLSQISKLKIITPDQLRFSSVDIELQNVDFFVGINSIMAACGDGHYGISRDDASNEVTISFLSAKQSLAMNSAPSLSGSVASGFAVKPEDKSSSGGQHKQENSFYVNRDVMDSYSQLALKANIQRDIDMPVTINEGEVTTLRNIEAIQKKAEMLAISREAPAMPGFSGSGVLTFRHIEAAVKAANSLVTQEITTSAPGKVN
jgi:hypothetical protein